MTDRELLQQALDALAQSWVNDHHGNRKQVLAMCADDFEKPFRALLALRKRLAQCDRCGKASPAEIHTCTPRESGCAECGKKSSDGWALYCVECTKPMREWVGLTDEDMNKLRHLVDWTVPLDIKKVARAIEAKLKEKNNG
jgi:hypothetical protein